MRQNPKAQQIADERVVEYLRLAIFDGKCGLSDVPRLLKRVIEDNLWQERILSKTQERVVFSRFEEFLQTVPPQGLGCDFQTLRNLCRNDLELIALLEEVKTQRFHGGDQRSDNFKTDNIRLEKNQFGTSLEYSLKRLKTLRPDLHSLVLTGKLSVNRAMIEANLRKKKFQISLDIEEIGKFIRKNFSPPEIELLLR
jgi:hypothetical protein